MLVCTFGFKFPMAFNVKTGHLHFCKGGKCYNNYRIISNSKIMKFLFLSGVHWKNYHDEMNHAVGYFSVQGESNFEHPSLSCAYLSTISLIL